MTINSMHDDDRDKCEACPCCPHEGRFELEGVWVELCGGCARALRTACFSDEKIMEALRDLVALSVGEKAITATINVSAVKKFGEDIHDDGGQALTAGLDNTIAALVEGIVSANTKLYNAVMTWCTDRKKGPTP